MNTWVALRRRHWCWRARGFGHGGRAGDRSRRVGPSRIGTVAVRVALSNDHLRTCRRGRWPAPGGSYRRRRCGTRRCGRGAGGNGRATRRWGGGAGPIVTLATDFRLAVASVDSRCASWSRGRVGVVRRRNTGRRPGIPAPFPCGFGVEGRSRKRFRGGAFRDAGPIHDKRAAITFKPLAATQASGYSVVAETDGPKLSARMFADAVGRDTVIDHGVVSSPAIIVHDGRVVVDLRHLM